MVLSNVPLAPISYVPILKAKRAELDAVASCASDNLVPLFEALEPGSSADNIAKAWPSADHVTWVQAFNGEGAEDATFAKTVEALFARLRVLKVTVVPVLTTTEEPMTLAAIASAVSLDKRGAVLRIDVEDLLDAAANVAADIAATIQALQLVASDVDLVVDAGLISGTPTVQSAVATQALGALPQLPTWRSVVVSFSAFPAAVGDVVPKESVVAIPRSDAAAFIATRNASTRPIVFGDYAVGVPTYGGAPFTPIPNMRYASHTEWYVHRAKDRKQPSPQYRALAKSIVNASYFDGAGFSPADQWISDVATSSSGPGNATTHLKIGMSRHLHVVLSRLANLGAP